LAQNPVDDVEQAPLQAAQGRHSGAGGRDRSVSTMDQIVQAVEAMEQLFGMGSHYKNGSVYDQG
jgi:hypothetical protein